MAKAKLLPLEEYRNSGSRDISDQIRYVTKINSIASEQLGIGKFQGDPLELIETQERHFFGQQARLEYRGLDIVQRIIDAPVKDALRAGYKHESNYDELNIGKLFDERVKELKTDEKLKQFLINSRLYSRGGVIYPIMNEYIMDAGRSHWAQPLHPQAIEKIKGFNTPPEDFFDYQVQSFDALADGFGEIFRVNIQGQVIDQSRLFFAIDGLDMFKHRGTSMLDRILVACKALNIAEWTIANLLLRYRSLIMKYPASEIHGTNTKKKKALAALINDIKMKFTSKSVAAVPDNYSFEYLQTTFTGIKEATTFLYEYLATTAEQPQSIIKGSALGELASAEKDQRDYYETVKANEQEGKIAPFFQWLMPLILNEKSGKIAAVLSQHGISPNDVTIETIFEPMQSVNPLQDAQINQINAQTAQLDIANGVRNADEVRETNYPTLDGSSTAPTDMLDSENFVDTMRSMFDEQGQLLPPGEGMMSLTDSVRSKFETLVA